MEKKIPNYGNKNSAFPKYGNFFSIFWKKFFQNAIFLAQLFTVYLTSKKEKMTPITNE